jgi:hypothetical protein
MLLRLGYLIVVLLIVGCKVQPTIQTIVHTKKTLEPTILEKNLSDGLSLQIEPVSDVDLNKETYLAAIRSSNNGEWTASYQESTSSSKGESQYPKFIRFLNQLKSDGMISEGLTETFKIEFFKQNLPTEPLILDDLKDTKDFPESYNPFINKKLSLFRLIFSNESDSVQRISLNSLYINSNLEQLSPLSTKYFDTIYDPRSPQYNNVLRMNMPNELVVLPNQKVQKYIAVPAINPLNESFSISYLSGNRAISYEFLQHMEQQTNSFLVFLLDPAINDKNTMSYSNSPKKLIMILEENGSFMHANETNAFLVKQDAVDDFVSVYFINYYKNTFIFGAKRNFKFSTFTKNYRVYIPQLRADVIRGN